MIIVSHGSAEWLGPCLTSLFEHAGELPLDVVVVENGEPKKTNELVHSRFPTVRVLECENRGFAHANNVGLRSVSAPFVLFLNADTEVVAGTLAELVNVVSSRPEWGLVGVRQVTPEGELWPTIRRFPNAARTLFEALRRRKPSMATGWLGERELDLSKYEDEQECDWTSGSFMLARRRRSTSGTDGRALFPLLRGTRSLPADQAGRRGRSATAIPHDHPSRRPGQVERSVVRAGSICPAAIHGKALLEAASRRGSRGDVSRALAALDLRWP